MSNSSKVLKDIISIVQRIIIAVVFLWVVIPVYTAPSIDDAKGAYMHRWEVELCKINECKGSEDANRLKRMMSLKVSKTFDKASEMEFGYLYARNALKLFRLNSPVIYGIHLPSTENIIGEKDIYRNTLTQDGGSNISYNIFFVLVASALLNSLATFLLSKIYSAWHQPHSDKADDGVDVENKSAETSKETVCEDMKGPSEEKPSEEKPFIKKASHFKAVFDAQRNKKRGEKGV